MKEWTGRSNLRTVRQNGAMAFSNALLLETSELQTPPEVRLNGAGANGQFSLLQLFGPRYFRRRVRRNRATSAQGRAEGRHSWTAEICACYFLGWSNKIVESNKKIYICRYIYFFSRSHFFLSVHGFTRTSTMNHFEQNAPSYSCSEAAIFWTRTLKLHWTRISTRHELGSIHTLRAGSDAQDMAAESVAWWTSGKGLLTLPKATELLSHSTRSFVGIASCPSLTDTYFIYSKMELRGRY